MRIKNDTKYDTAKLRKLFGEALRKFRKVENCKLSSKELAVRVYYRKTSYKNHSRGYAYKGKIFGQTGWKSNRFWKGVRYFVKIGLPKTEYNTTDMQSVFVHELFHCVGYGHRNMPSRKVIVRQIVE